MFNTIQQEINSLNPDIKVYSVLGNMVNMSFMEDLFRKKNINIVFHAAAYKHVPLVEENPFQGIHNNINSTINLCKVVQKYDVDHALLISSDKARPTNFMELQKDSRINFQGFSFTKTKFVSLDLEMFLDHLDQLFLSFVFKLVMADL